MSSLVPWAFGTSGVDLFFVISGFIRVVTTSGTGMGPGEFWRRASRPLYWLLTLLMIAVALVAPGLFKTLKVAPSTLVQSLLFIPHFSQSFPGVVWPLLVPGWTLNFEMFFYAVFGLALLLPERNRLLPLVTFFVMLTAIGLVFGPFASAAAQTYTHPMLLEFAAVASRSLPGG
jgi:exopolysaccharide production protein ExoZ